MGGVCTFTRKSAVLVTTVNPRVYIEHTQSAMRHIRCASICLSPETLTRSSAICFKQVEL